MKAVATLAPDNPWINIMNAWLTKVIPRAQVRGSRSRVTIFNLLHLTNDQLGAVPDDERWAGV